MHFNHLISTLVLACLVSGCSETDTDSLQITKTDNGQLENVDSINVSLREASLAAKTFMKEAMPDKRLSRSSALPEIISENGVPAMYVINFENGGYVVISAVKKLAPVLAYGKTGSFDGTGCPGVEDWTESVKYLAYNTDKIQPDSAKVNIARWRRFNTDTNIPVSRSTNGGWEEIDPDRREYLNKVMMDSIQSWNRQGFQICGLHDFQEKFPDYYDPRYEQIARESVWVEYEDLYDLLTVVLIKTEGSSHQSILLETKWNQTGSFNQTFPPVGNLDHAFAGCSTVAAGQVMYYYKHPDYIDWDGMPLNTGSVTTSNFLYDIASNSNPKYDNDGTGISLGDLQNTMRNRYNYIVDYGNWNTTTAKSNIDAGKPVIVGGDNKMSDSAHAYVCCGFSSFWTATYVDLWTVTDPTIFRSVETKLVDQSGASYFYINWGWGGYKDGFFADMSNLNADSNHIYKSKKMLYNISPIK